MASLRFLNTKIISIMDAPSISATGRLRQASLRELVTNLVYTGSSGAAKSYKMRL